MRGHWDFGFGAEILNDDFLDVAVFFVERSNRKERVDAFVHGLADADEYAGREGHGELPCFLDGAEAKGRYLIGSFGVRQTIAHQTRAEVFEHQAGARLRLFQARESGALQSVAS